MEPEGSSACGATIVWFGLFGGGGWKWDQELSLAEELALEPIPYGRVPYLALMW